MVRNDKRRTVGRTKLFFYSIYIYIVTYYLSLPMGRHRKKNQLYFSHMKTFERLYSQGDLPNLRIIYGKQERARSRRRLEVGLPSSGGRLKTLSEALAESPLHAASLLYSSASLITPRRYLVTDNVPDKDWRLTVMYRYRVEW